MAGGPALVGVPPDSFASDDGLALRCWTAVPAGVPRGRVVLVHGFGEHARSLPCRLLTEALLQRSFVTCGFDLRGHGLSPGPRMDTPSWEHLRADVKAFLDLVQADGPRLPTFLLGNSLGGLLALDAAIHGPTSLAGVVALAPAVDESGVPGTVRLVVPLLARIAPRLPIDPGLDLASLSRDRELAESYLADPLFQRRTTPRLGAAVLGAMRTTRRRAGHLAVPLLMLHGEADRVVPAAGSAAFFAAAGSRDRTRIAYPGAGHNLPIETCRARVFADIAEWLEARAQPAE